MASEANAGTDNGRMIRQNIVVWPAPSTLAASITSPGISEMKLWRRKMPRGARTWCGRSRAGHRSPGGICSTWVKQESAAGSAPSAGG